MNTLDYTMMMKTEMMCCFIIITIIFWINILTQ